jgi:hypothetical protein
MRKKRRKSKKRANSLSGESGPATFRTYAPGLTRARSGLILQDNMRQLIEQAAGSSGARDEERTSERITQQQAQLDKVVKQRDAMLKNSSEARDAG